MQQTDIVYKKRVQEDEERRDETMKNEQLKYYRAYWHRFEFSRRSEIEFRRKGPGFGARPPRITYIITLAYLTTMAAASRLLTTTLSRQSYYYYYYYIGGAGGGLCASAAVAATASILSTEQWNQNSQTNSNSNRNTIATVQSGLARTAACSLFGSLV
jgi:hypothetical protein